jgi:two-component system chemotaxis sensor kinase CheA
MTFSRSCSACSPHGPPVSDTSKYLPLFVREATEHAQQLGLYLPALRAPTCEPDLVDELHRHAHSLKGMSAAMGFDEIAELARGAEGILERMRGRQPMPGSAAANPLAQAQALLLEMIQARAAGSVMAGDPRLVAVMDEALLDGGPPTPPVAA